MNTVDGRIPVDSWFIPLFTGFYTSQVVVAGFLSHQHVLLLVDTSSHDSSARPPRRPNGRTPRDQTSRSERFAAAIWCWQLQPLGFGQVSASLARCPKAIQSPLSEVHVQLVVQSRCSGALVGFLQQGSELFTVHEWFHRFCFASGFCGFLTSMWFQSCSNPKVKVIVKWTTFFALLSGV